MTLDLEQIQNSLITASIAVVVLLTVRIMIFLVVQNWVQKDRTPFANAVLKSFKLLRIPTIYWSFAIALLIGIASYEPSTKYIVYLTKSIYILLILSLSIVIAGIIKKMFRTLIENTDVDLPTTGLAVAVAQVAVYLFGMAGIFAVLGLSITPIVTALGIGGLAVALALQDTLANMFAGVHIMLEKSVRVGDYVKLESGQEGYVDDITWRTTRIRMLPNNMVIVPNNKLSQIIVTNYNMPEKRMSLLIQVGVSYDADPDHVEMVLIDEAKNAVGEVSGLLGEPEPIVRFIPGFGESSLDFTLICQVHEFVDQYLVQHELRKRIFRRFKAEGIEIPYPQKVVHIRQGSL